MSEVISCSIPKKLLRTIDSIRGDVPRSKYIIRQLESVLSKKSIEKPSVGKSSETAN
ncbi:MAG: hypothetical protein ACRD8W_00910 [Nitrososphaeraceae archaeon]